MNSVNVNLGGESYHIIIDSNIIGNLGLILSEVGINERCAIITDSNVNQLLGKTVRESLEEHGYPSTILEIPVGEAQKTMDMAMGLVEQLVEQNFNRQTPIIALGGGMITDLAGFVAAIYMRGVPLINIPTTLLGQVDSAIGGKVGVNYGAGKNLLGTFYHPKLVLSDLKVLKSLPKREIKSGFAEVMKYGIAQDRDFFEYLEKNSEKLNDMDTDFLENIVTRSCEIKVTTIEKDVRDETGMRAVLNYGHTFGHAFEAASNYEKYLHGEAVALGMAYSGRLAWELEIMPEDDLERQNALIKTVGLDLTIKDIDIDNVVEAIFLDKKKRDREYIRFILPERIGKTRMVDDVTPDMVKEVLEETMV